MDTVTVILDFFSCSVVLGVFYRLTADIDWAKKHAIKLPKSVKRRHYFFIAIVLLMSAFFLYSSFRRGSFGFWGVAACLVNAYFIAYALWLKRIYWGRYVGISLLPSVLLLLAIIFDSIFWAVLSGIVIVILFVVGRFIELIFDKIFDLSLNRSQVIRKHYNNTDDARVFLKNEIWDAVYNFFADYLSQKNYGTVPNISADSSLRYDLEITKEVLEWGRVSWERLFHIDISDQELFSENIQCVGDIIDLIEDKIIEQMHFDNSKC